MTKSFRYRHGDERTHTYMEVLYARKNHRSQMAIDFFRFNVSDIGMVTHVHIHTLRCGTHARTIAHKWQSSPSDKIHSMQVYGDAPLMLGNRGTDFQTPP